MDIFFSLRSELENLLKKLKITLRIVELSIWRNAIIIASDFQAARSKRRTLYVHLLDIVSLLRLSDAWWYAWASHHVSLLPNLIHLHCRDCRVLTCHLSWETPLYLASSLPYTNNPPLIHPDYCGRHAVLNRGIIFTSITYTSDIGEILRNMFLLLAGFVFFYRLLNCILK